MTGKPLVQKKLYPKIVFLDKACCEFFNCVVRFRMQREIKLNLSIPLKNNIEHKSSNDIWWGRHGHQLHTRNI